MMSPICRALFALCALTAPVMGADEGYETGRAGFGAFVVPPDLDTLAERNLVPGDGAIVLGVRPGSTADSLGIQAGDVVRTINGTPIQSFRDVRSLVRAASPGEAIEVVVTRANGQTVVLDGDFKERLPRRLGRPPWAMGMPGAMPPWGMGDRPWPPPSAAEIIAAQRQQLFDEQRRLDAIAADLAAARAAMPPSGAWICTYDVTIGDPAIEDEEAP